MKEKVNYIVNKLIQNGFLFTGNADESHYYFSNGKVMVCYVTPHSGTDNLHMIRAEIIEDFDRWSNAQYEEFISEKHEILKVIMDLECIESVEED